MERLPEDTYKKLFLTAAIWNIAGGLTSLLFFELSMKLLWGTEYIELFYDNRMALSTYRLFWGLVIIFGVGYYIVSRDINKNRIVLWMAIAGKLWVFGIWSYDYHIGKIQFLGFFGGLGDFIFTLLFIHFLLTDKKVPILRGK